MHVVWTGRDCSGWFTLKFSHIVPMLLYMYWWVHRLSWWAQKACWCWWLHTRDWRLDLRVQLAVVRPVNHPWRKLLSIRPNWLSHMLRKRMGRRINLGSIWREILSLPARMFLCGCLTIYQLVYVSHFWVALDYQLYSNTCSVIFSSFLCWVSILWFVGPLGHCDSAYKALRHSFGWVTRYRNMCLLTVQIQLAFACHCCTLLEAHRYLVFKFGVDLTYSTPRTDWAPTFTVCSHKNNPVKTWVLKPCITTVSAEWKTPHNTCDTIQSHAICLKWGNPYGHGHVMQGEQQRAKFKVQWRWGEYANGVSSVRTCRSVYRSDICARRGDRRRTDCATGLANTEHV